MQRKSALNRADSEIILLETALNFSVLNGVDYIWDFNPGYTIKWHTWWSLGVNNHARCISLWPCHDLAIITPWRVWITMIIPSHSMIVMFEHSCQTRNQYSGIKLLRNWKTVLVKIVRIINGSPRIVDWIIKLRIKNFCRIRLEKKTILVLDDVSTDRPLS